MVGSARNQMTGPEIESNRFFLASVNDSGLVGIIYSVRMVLDNFFLSLSFYVSCIVIGFNNA